jgi:hypothetical protein
MRSINSILADSFAGAARAYTCSTICRFVLFVGFATPSAPLGLVEKGLRNRLQREYDHCQDDADKDFFMSGYARETQPQIAEDRTLEGYRTLQASTYARRATGGLGLMSLKAGDWAVWFQAVGSIAAIGAGFVTVYWQMWKADQQRKRDRDDRATVVALRLSGWLSEVGSRIEVKSETYKRLVWDDGLPQPQSLVGQWKLNVASGIEGVMPGQGCRSPASRGSKGFGCASGQDLKVNHGTDHAAVALGLNGPAKPFRRPVSQIPPCGP